MGGGGFGSQRADPAGGGGGGVIPGGGVKAGGGGGLGPRRAAPAGGGGGGGGMLDALPLGFIDAGPEGARFESIPDPDATVRTLKGGAAAIATLATTFAGLRALCARRRRVGGGPRGLLGR